jgi:hypothetical protein
MRACQHYNAAQCTVWLSDCNRRRNRPDLIAEHAEKRLYQHALAYE